MVRPASDFNLREVAHDERSRGGGAALQSQVALELR